jgi:hypothetical protein
MFNKIIYLDPFSVLVVNKKGKLVRVHCPFLARSLLESEIKREIVELVLVESESEFSFLIEGKKYPSKYWDIII